MKKELDFSTFFLTTIIVISDFQSRMPITLKRKMKINRSSRNYLNFFFVFCHSPFPPEVFLTWFVYYVYTRPTVTAQKQSRQTLRSAFAVRIPRKLPRGIRGVWRIRAEWQLASINRDARGLSPRLVKRSKVLRSLIENSGKRSGRD